jgi:serine/threonine protein kinase
MYSNKYPFLDPNIKYDVPHALRDIIKNDLILPANPKRSMVM